MDHLRIADLLHADTMNFLLEATGLHELQEIEVAYPILVRPTPAEWIAIVPRPGIDGYVAVPVLRKLRKDKGGRWRHFPMALPGGVPVHPFESEGAPISVQSVAELPTWSCVAVFGVLPALKDELANVIGCLELCAHFPQLSSLRVCATRLREQCYGGWHRSYELQLELLVAQQQIAHASAWKTVGPSATRSSQVPSSIALADGVLGVYQAIRETDIPIGAAAVSPAFLEAASRYFDLEGRSSFLQVAGETGGSPAKADNWPKKERVRLFPRALDGNFRKRLDLE